MKLLNEKKKTKESSNSKEKSQTKTQIMPEYLDVLDSFQKIYGQCLRNN